jgi:hypothetical protein
MMLVKETLFLVTLSRPGPTLSGGVEGWQHHRIYSHTTC